ncbi:hypothetical protein [Chryseobacterium sp. AG363]|uniref:hypothetical protein n=1 Tax=Chryseobacterium sp. AG363 TaxID=2183997 RepID=UPI000E712085|nr:hypothetical protein [Chryseobacterium sp. AG363]RKE81584.1 hypothetical protein DEU39_1121 [Chryseobacterium sp. AG363]
MKTFTCTFAMFFLIAMPVFLAAQNSITLNGEKILAKDFVDKTGSPWNKLGYGNDENLYRSPFFGQKNAIKFEATSVTEIGYKRLGYLCPQARRGVNVVDYNAPSEFLPLFNNGSNEDSWDDLIFGYFSNHLVDVKPEFVTLWNSPQYVTNKAKKALLLRAENKDIREHLYSLFIQVESVSDYTQKTKKETELNAQIKADIKADLDQYFKNNSINNETANKIKSETRVTIDNKLTNNNVAEIKYYRLKLNGDFLSLIQKYAKFICEKKAANQALVGFENDFYKRYMIPDKVFLITNLQYVSYKIDKTRKNNAVTSIVEDINATLAKNQIPGLDVSFGAKITYKIDKQVDKDFKSSGGYILQIAENDQVGAITGDCSKL